MLLSFYGAAGEVTGSCFYLEACGKHLMIDCGMRQGPEAYVEQELPYVPAEVDFLLVTHAHIDHSGKIPMLARYGFQGEIHSTRATANLCRILLLDSAHIQEFEAEWRNRKGQRAGEEPIEPLYGIEDVEAAMKLFHRQPYGEKIELAPGLVIRFTDVGHMLGSSTIELWVTEEGVTQKLVFSGDIGNINRPLLKDPAYIEGADYVVMESTYGNRNHHAPPDFSRALARVIQQTFDKGGNVVIPAFAVGRTQELLYGLREIQEAGLVTGHGTFPVYVDSPLAAEATAIFQKHEEDCYDQEAKALLAKGINPLSFPGLVTSVTSDQSKAINEDKRCKVILSASGMCDAGRIRHHLKHNLWREESTILFVGYQAEGTLGRALLEGTDSCKLFGEEIQVKANIRRLEGISGHADQQGLLHWVDKLDCHPRRIFVVHGEPEASEELARILGEEKGHSVSVPAYGSCYDLHANSCVREGIQRTAVKKDSKKGSRVYQRLMAVGQRLIAVIQKNKQCANKDLARFADQVQALCDKWDR